MERKKRIVESNGWKYFVIGYKGLKVISDLLLAYDKFMGQLYKDGYEEKVCG